MINEGTKCKGLYCPLKSKCLRFTSKSRPIMQDYISFIPYKGDSCKFFIPNRIEPVQAKVQETVIEQDPALTVKPKRSRKKKQ